MIRVDCRAGSKEYASLLSALNCPTTRTTLPFGDLAFEGSGPDGVVEVGVEVKTLGDFASSYRNHRLQRQLRGMKRRYDVSILLITHATQEEVNAASMMSLYFQAQVLTHIAQDDGARWVATLYNWWQKPWDKHTSMHGLYLPQPDEESLIPVEPSGTRIWAAVLPGVGWELSGRIARVVACPGDLVWKPGWMDEVAGIGKVKRERIRAWIAGAR